MPQDGINIIFGENAQGKTNVLEAIWLFTGGRSFRGAKDAELVAFHQPKATIALDFFSQEREQHADITVLNGRRSVKLNGVQKKSASQLIGTFCAVIFSPEHLSLVKEGPSGRRNFLDAALCQIKPAYAALLSHYNHTLIQRNALLKDIPRHAELLDTLSVWDERLVRYGTEVVRQRRSYVQALSAPAAEVYAGISGGKESFGLSYLCTAEDLAAALVGARREDLQSGHTTVGPHRDDLEITVNDLSARSFGSQGQQRSLVLALKLAEADVLQMKTGERPVILLDDVMSELDGGRQDYLLNHLKNRQVFITCCEPDLAGRLKQGARFEVKGGVIRVSASGAGYGY